MTSFIAPLLMGLVRGETSERGLVKGVYLSGYCAGSDLATRQPSIAGREG